MEADKTILQMKYARIVKLFAEQTGISLEDSLEIFYDSYVYKMMSEGIADMHCRSDGYLAGLLSLTSAAISIRASRLSQGRCFLSFPPRRML